MIFVRKSDRFKKTGMVNIEIKKLVPRGEQNNLKIQNKEGDVKDRKRKRIPGKAQRTWRMSK